MGLNIADLKIGDLDAVEAKVVGFFARKPPEYAVYATPERVSLQFADKPEDSSRQRAALTRLFPLRSEINGLIDGWRLEMPGSENRRRAERYDRRVGAALAVAFEADCDSALLQLQAIKQDIIDERVANARFEYLIAAFFTGLLAALFAGISTSVHKYPEIGLDIWRGCIGGAVGAFFSIALAIRGRTVLPDLQRKANLMDAVLRVVIGIIGGGILVSMLRLGFVKMSLGDADLGQLTGDNATSWLETLVFGVLAGFSERLVGDLLAKAAATPTAPPPKPQATASGVDAAKGSAADAKPAGNDTQSDKIPDTDHAPEQAADDHCVSDVTLDDADVTPDERLPGAAGGVAKPKGVS